MKNTKDTRAELLCLPHLDLQRLRSCCANGPVSNARS